MREALHAPIAAGLVRHIEPADSQARLGGRVVSSLTSTARSARPCPTASDDHGFSTDQAEAIHWGLRPDCSTAHRLFHLLQFLRTVLRPIRKDSHD